MSKLVVYSDDIKWYCGVLNTEITWTFITSPDFTPKSAFNNTSKVKGAEADPTGVVNLAHAMARGTTADISAAIANGSIFGDVLIDPELTELITVTWAEGVELTLSEMLVWQAAPGETMELSWTAVAEDIIEALPLTNKREALKDSEPYTINFINYNLITTFERNDCNVFSYSDAGESKFNIQVISFPDSTLIHTQGGQTLQFIETWTKVFSILTANAWCIWSDPATLKRFGVQLHVPQQVATIGTAPYYQIFYDDTQGKGQVNWITPVDDPSKPYTFPEDKVGFKIDITPQAYHDKLTLTVTVHNKKVD